MRKSIGLIPVGLVMSVLGACSSGSDVAGTSSAASGRGITPSSTTPHDMIVILRDQMESVAGRAALPMRANAIATAHATILSSLQAARPRSATSFKLVNAFATSLTSDEVDTLSARGDVLAVVPNRVLRLPKKARRDVDAAALGAPSPQGGAQTPPPADGLCNTLEPEALQIMNAAFLDPTVPQAQTVKDGNGHLVTGSGVKVGIIADGLDINLPGFIRADGSKVFANYQNFTGDPSTASTGGAEMFGDASSIAAQDVSNGTTLQFDISRYVGAGYPLPSPCNVRIRGLSPGASLYGYNVFGTVNTTTTANFVQAIEYAVANDNVDVLNESFGGNPYPDLDNDPISLANAAAVRAGVTVVVSSGDAGTAGTLGSPSTAGGVIEVGATTQYRLYAQTHSGAYALASGYVGDNIASFSSAGFAELRPRTVDVVAPGDSGWALCSTNTAVYTECSAKVGVEDFGGTSESAPLTSGAAALVIQAYRSTHGGASPSPALVKRILMGTATDLGAPSFEEGAGRVDALKAVYAALSVHDDNGAPAPQGAGVLLATPSASVLTAKPGERLSTSYEITNTGASTVKLAPALEKLGAPVAGETKEYVFDPATAPKFKNAAGAQVPYQAYTFDVPAGADHLDVAIAFPLRSPAGNATFAALMVADPSGKQAAYSTPQGYGNGYGHVDVVHPVAGKWTAYVRTLAAEISGAAGQLSGALQLSWSAERYVSFGQVSPKTLTLGPGEKATVSASFNAPTAAGDFAGALRLHDAQGAATFSEIPVTVRTLIAVGPEGGDFTGTLTGSNGRQGVFPTTTYAFDVPSGVNRLGVSLTLPTSGYALNGFLVDPNGQLLASDSSTDPSGALQSSLQLFRANPKPGRWLFVLEESGQPGTQTAVAFTGHVSLDSDAGASAPGLPNSASKKLSAATGMSVALTVTNTGAVAKAYFVDARLTATTDLTLPGTACSAASSLPGDCVLAYVPPRTSSVRFAVQAPSPVQIDAELVTGNPEIFGHSSGNGAVASLTAPEVAFGAWYVLPSLIGPYGAGGANPTDAGTPVTVTATATAQAFDTAVSSSSGDYWADAVFNTSTFKPVVIAAGATGTIDVTIKPAASQVGHAVHGTLYVDAVNPTDLSTNGFAGDEVARLPYAYTVAK